MIFLLVALASAPSSIPVGAPQPSADAIALPDISTNELAFNSGTLTGTGTRQPPARGKSGATPPGPGSGGGSGG